MDEDGWIISVEASPYSISYNNIHLDTLAQTAYTIQLTTTQFPKIQFKRFKKKKRSKKNLKAIKCNKGALGINSKSYLKSMNAFISTFTLTFTQRHNFYYFIFISLQKENEARWNCSEGGVWMKIGRRNATPWKLTEICIVTRKSYFYISVFPTSPSASLFTKKLCFTFWDINNFQM